MELNIWLQSTIATADFSDETQTWSVDITRGDGSTRKMTPSHVVFCTGHAGEPRVPTFPGQDSFAGTVYHGSQHKDATFQGDVSGKKVVVVGTGNSGHDVAQNYYENGASVTMLQRSGTYVISAKTGLFMLHEGLYEEGGPDTDDADVFGQSLPIPVQFALNVGGTERIAAAEKESLDGLRKIGFKLDFGHDGSGIYRKYVTRGGGYYIDVGASQLLIDGKIKLEQSPDGIKGFGEKSLILADGRELEADVVVLATGYDSMNTTLRKAMGDKIADRCKEVWDLDDEGEIRTVRRFLDVLVRNVTDRSRCGVPQGILSFGSWVVVWRCVGSIPSSWRSRSKHTKRVWWIELSMNSFSTGILSFDQYMYALFDDIIQTNHMLAALLVTSILSHAVKTLASRTSLFLFPDQSDAHGGLAGPPMHSGTLLKMSLSLVFLISSCMRRPQFFSFTSTGTWVNLCEALGTLSASLMAPYAPYPALKGSS